MIGWGLWRPPIRNHATEGALGNIYINASLGAMHQCVNVLSGPDTEKMKNLQGSLYSYNPITNDLPLKKQITQVW